MCIRDSSSPFAVVIIYVVIGPLGLVLLSHLPSIGLFRFCLLYTSHCLEDERSVVSTSQVNRLVRTNIRHYVY